MFTTITPAMKSVSLILLFLGLVTAFDCTAQYECIDVSDDYNYVRCVTGGVTGVCQCKTELGFIGDASPGSKCRCPTAVYWGGGLPWCINCTSPRHIVYDEQGMPQCVNIGECGYTNLVTERLKQTVFNFWLLYSNSTDFTSPTVGLFAENFTLRSDPTTIIGFDQSLALEYLVYGGHPENGTIVGGIPFKKFVLKALLADVEHHMVTSVIDVTISTNFSPVLVTVTGFFIISLDNNFKITAIESTFPALGEVIDPPVAAHNAVIKAICDLEQAKCVGDYDVYPTHENCTNFLKFSIPFGSFSVGYKNNVICRLIHRNLAQRFPEIHCPHLAPDSPVCNDYPRSVYVLQNNTFMPNIEPVTIYNIL